MTAAQLDWTQFGGNPYPDSTNVDVATVARVTPNGVVGVVVAAYFPDQYVSGSGYASGNRSTFISGSGDGHFVGSSAFDTAYYLQGGRADYQIQILADRPTGFDLAVIKPGGATDFLLSVERVTFNDASITFDPAGSTGKIYRAFSIAFATKPLPETISFWVKAADAGTSVASIIQSFVASPQFQSIYGSNDQPGALVNKLYQQALHRAPEAASLAFWMDDLTKHPGDVASLVTALAESTDMQIQVMGVLHQGVVTF